MSESHIRSLVNGMAAGLSATVLVCSLSACAHAGLVTGPRVDGPITDRSAFVETMTAASEANTMPDYKGEAEEYARSRHVPAAMQIALEEADASFRAMKDVIHNVVKEIQSGMEELDTSMPEYTLPETKAHSLPETKAHSLPGKHWKSAAKG